MTQSIEFVQESLSDASLITLRRDTNTGLKVAALDANVENTFNLALTTTNTLIYKSPCCWVTGELDWWQSTPTQNVFLRSGNPLFSFTNASPQFLAGGTDPDTGITYPPRSSAQVFPMSLSASIFSTNLFKRPNPKDFVARWSGPTNSLNPRGFFPPFRNNNRFEFVFSGLDGSNTSTVPVNQTNAVYFWRKFIEQPSYRLSMGLRISRLTPNAPQSFILKVMDVTERYATGMTVGATNSWFVVNGIVYQGMTASKFSDNVNYSFSLVDITPKIQLTNASVDSVAPEKSTAEVNYLISDKTYVTLTLDPDNYGEKYPWLSDIQSKYSLQEPQIIYLNDDNDPNRSTSFKLNDILYTDSTVTLVGELNNQIGESFTNDGTTRLSVSSATDILSTTAPLVPSNGSFWNFMGTNNGEMSVNSGEFYNVGMSDIIEPGMMYEFEFSFDDSNTPPTSYQKWFEHLYNNGDSGQSVLHLTEFNRSNVGVTNSTISKGDFRIVSFVNSSRVIVECLSGQGYLSNLTFGGGVLPRTYFVSYSLVSTSGGGGGVGPQGPTGPDGSVGPAGTSSTIELSRNTNPIFDNSFEYIPVFSFAGPSVVITTKTMDVSSVTFSYITTLTKYVDSNIKPLLSIIQKNDSSKFIICRVNSYSISDELINMNTKVVNQGSQIDYLEPCIVSFDLYNENEKTPLIPISSYFWNYIGLSTSNIASSGTFLNKGNSNNLTVGTTYSFVFSQSDVESNNVSGFLNHLFSRGNSSDSLLHITEYNPLNTDPLQSVSSKGDFRINSFNGTSSMMNVTLVSGNGSMVNFDPSGAPSPKLFLVSWSILPAPTLGPPTGGQIRVDNFSSITSSTIFHNFGFYPQVQVVDNNGDIFIPEKITHTSTMSYTVLFSGVSSGRILSGGGAGPQGATGAMGSQGPTGAVGNQGPTGDVLYVGQQGPTGPQGATGPEFSPGFPIKFANGSTAISFESPTISVWGDLVPVSNYTFDLGKTDSRWNNLFVKDIFMASQSIYLGDVKLSSSSGQLIIEDLAAPGGGSPTLILSTLPDGQVAFGSGTGITSSSSFTFNNSTFRFNAASLSSVDTSSCFSSILGGRLNTISGTSSCSSIIGGASNTITRNATASSIIGGSNNNICTLSSFSSIIGGCCNIIQATSSFSTILGGRRNVMGTHSCASIIIGGCCNRMIGRMSGPFPTVHGSSIIGGYCNTVYDSYASIIGGRYNTINEQVMNSSIIGGQCNLMSCHTRHSSIVGGALNTIKATSNIYGTGNTKHSVVLGGAVSLINDSCNAAIIGGSLNKVHYFSHRSSIVGGCTNSVYWRSCNSSIVGGFANCLYYNSCNSSITSGCGNKLEIFSCNSIISGGRINLISSNSMNSSIVGGVCNSMCCGRNSTIIGGQNNILICESANSSIIGGTGSIIEKSCGSLILGGDGYNGTPNYGASGGNLICGGKNNIVSGGFQYNSPYYSYNYPNRMCNSCSSNILGGKMNFMDNVVDSSILGGSCNTLSCNSKASSVLGGSCNTLSCNSCCSTIIGGTKNKICCNSRSASIIGGCCNTVHYFSSHSSVIGGECGIIECFSNYSSIVGGNENKICCESTDSSILGGICNTIFFFTCKSTIVGGGYNTLSSNSNFSSISGGCINVLSKGSNLSSIVGGSCNKICCDSINSSIMGGQQNLIFCSNLDSSIIGGIRNTISDCNKCSTIIGGSENLISCRSYNSSIIGGKYNTIAPRSSYVSIIGGFCNIVSTTSSNSSIIGGVCNRISQFSYNSLIIGGCCNTLQTNSANSVIIGGRGLSFSNTCNRVIVPSMIIASASTTRPHMNLIAGASPSVPVNGDLWFDGSNLWFRRGGVSLCVCLKA